MPQPTRSLWPRGGLWRHGGLTIWQLFAVGFATGTLTVFFDVAYQAYLPSLVGRSQLVDGNSKLEISRSAAQLGGPGFAGLLISAISAPYALVADALSFVGSAAFLGRIRRREEHVQPRGAPRAGMLGEVREGLRNLLRDPYFRAVWGTIPVGSLLGGVIASEWGTRTTVLVGAIGATVAFVPVLLSPFRSLKIVTPLVEPGPADA